MKSIIIILFLLLLRGISYAQDSTSRWRDLSMMIGLGEHETFINNTGFNAWTQANYGRTINPSPNFSGQMSFAFKRYDGGVYFTGVYPFQSLGLNFGRRLTSDKSPIASFLNLEIGGLGAYYKNINPIDYTPTADQQGKSLQLHYDSYYVGLSSLNYFSFLRFHFKNKNNHLSLVSGFHVSARYGFGGQWTYGYNVNEVNLEGSGTDFKSVPIKTIPNMGNFIVDAGLFIGVGP